MAAEPDQNPEHDIDYVMEATIDEAKTDADGQFKEAGLNKRHNDHIVHMRFDLWRVRRSRHPHTLQVQVKRL